MRRAERRVSLLLPLALALLAGCGPRFAAPLQARELFPTGAYSAPRPVTMPCADAQRYVQARQQLPLDQPPPIPGDDRLPLTLKLDVRAKLVDVVALEIVHQDPGYRMYVGVAPRDDLDREIVVAAPDTWHVVARVLMRKRIDGGLFDDLSYCQEQWASVELAPEERTIELVVDDDPRTAASRGGLVWFDSVLMREPEPDAEEYEDAEEEEGEPEAQEEASLGY